MQADQEPARAHRGTRRLPLAAAVALTLPGGLLGAAELLAGWHAAALGPPGRALAYGSAVVGAAFLLSWAAEAAQLDVSKGLAIGALALVAVLPEYAVGFVFAWKGGRDVAQHGPGCSAPGGGSSNCALALANMTGANRLLIGVGWALVVLLAWWRFRRRGTPHDRVALPRGNSVELAFLAVAGAWGLTLPLRRSITLLDAAVLGAVFVAYTIRIAGGPAGAPTLLGPAAWIGALPQRRRRQVVLGLFAFAALVILLVAEQFAEALVDTGAQLGVSQFLLVQWVAPVASEAPELLVAGLYAWQLKTSEALTTLVSSKVNQWTLLVGTLPVVFAVASGSRHGLPIDPTRREELLLTAAQTVFAFALLGNLCLTVREALALLGLFAAQFGLGTLLPHRARGVELLLLSVTYLALGAWLVARHHHELRARLRDGFRASWAELQASDHGGPGRPAA